MFTALTHSLLRRGTLSVALALSALCSCSLDDPRDLCCTPCNVMRYTYRPYGAEAFGDYIFTLRHFLFDASGRYLDELPAGEDPRRQTIILPEGDYTMVTLGNLTDRSATDHAPDRHISLLTLTHTLAHMGGGAKANADELYWGVRSFHVTRAGRLSEPAAPLSGPEGSARGSEAPAPHALNTELNNIHCHLTVRVEWNNVPPYVGDYEMELDGVPSRYSLHPDRATDAEGFTVPAGDTRATHRLTVPLRSRELLGEFVTLRLSDDAIPVLRVRFGAEQVTPDIDLARAFRSWGWSPSATHVQKYSVMLRVFGDGHVDLYPYITASVEDWVDGGTFS